MGYLEFNSPGDYRRPRAARRDVTERAPRQSFGARELFVLKYLLFGHVRMYLAFWLDNNAAIELCAYGFRLAAL